MANCELRKEGVPLMQVHLPHYDWQLLADTMYMFAPCCPDVFAPQNVREEDQRNKTSCNKCRKHHFSFFPLQEHAQTYFWPGSVQDVSSVLPVDHVSVPWPGSSDCISRDCET